MDIFNIKIWGETADKFMAMSCADKKKFIKEEIYDSILYITSDSTIYKIIFLLIY